MGYIHDINQTKNANGMFDNFLQNFVPTKQINLNEIEILYENIGSLKAS